MLTLISLRCSRTCHEIPSIVRLRNGSQRLVLISRMDTRICVFISDWLVSYAPCDWSHSCEIFHAMLKINIIACLLYVLFCLALWFVCFVNLCCRFTEKRNERVLPFGHFTHVYEGHFMKCYEEEYLK